MPVSMSFVTLIYELELEKSHSRTSGNVALAGVTFISGRKGVFSPTPISIGMGNDMFTGKIMLNAMPLSGEPCWLPV